MYEHLVTSYQIGGNIYYYSTKPELELEYGHAPYLPCKSKNIRILNVSSSSVSFLLDFKLRNSYPCNLAIIASDKNYL